MQLMKVILLCLCATFLFTRLNNPSDACEKPFNTPQKIRCTCYIDHGYTKSGQWTRNGIIAGKKEWLGKIAAMYAISEDGELGEFIGYYEFLDTGAGMDTDGDGKGDTIKNGKSVDVWQPTMKDAKAWIKKYGDYVFMQIVEADG